jgi:hypothetical protein
LHEGVIPSIKLYVQDENGNTEPPKKAKPEAEEQTPAASTETETETAETVEE